MRGTSWGFAGFFVLQYHAGKLQPYKKSYSDKGGIVLGMYLWNFYPVKAHGIVTECGAL